MNRYIVLFLMVMMISLSFGLSQEIRQVSDNTVNVRIDADYHSIISAQSSDCPNENDLSENIIVRDGTVSQTVALLAEEIEIIINELVIGIYNKGGERVQQQTFNLLLDTMNDFDRIYLSNSFVLKDMYGFSINADLIKEDGDYHSLIETVDYDIVGHGHRSAPESISDSFLASYKTLADNFRSSYFINLPFKQPKLLIISHEGLTNALSPFIQWKQEKGFEVTVINKQDIADNPSSSQIRGAIRTYYNDTDNKPDYLLLLGNVSGNYSLPTFYYSDGQDNHASDLPYTVITGNDYFPNMHAGRISIESTYELVTILNKTINYEKTPYMTDTGWMERALIVAGNYATTLPIPITPILTSRWVAQLFHEEGYDDVIEIYWEEGDGGYGTTQIADALNRGVQFVNYRGWGDANGWHFPRFHRSHLGQTDGGAMSPIVTSWVCNTGDFANQVIDPSFGEYWVKMGTPTSPNGAVAFIGPSDLHTSTEFNNALCSGFHWGVQKEGIRSFGSASLRSKMEVYKNYPHNRRPGDFVDHYFHVYNILSDPSLKMWVLIPDEMNINIPDQISSAASHIEFDTPGLEGGYVTLTRDNEIYDTYRIDGDYVFIPLDGEDSEDIFITVSCENYLPVQKTIEVIPETGIAMDSYNFGNNDLHPGDEITLNVTFKNYSNSDISNVSVELSSPTEEYVTIVDGYDELGTIAANDTAEGNFVFIICSDCPRNEPIQLSLAISPTDNHAKIQTILGGLLFIIDDYEVESANEILDPGETANIQVNLTNHGEFDAANLKAYIISGSNAVEVQEEPVNFGHVPVGGSANASFSATASADAYTGRQVYFQLDFVDEDGLVTTSYFNITIGEVSNTDPTGPCRYGYYAYDSFDVDYEHAPTYEWINIDPEKGGPGEDMWLHDDGTETFDLPFIFQYYGEDYDEISICSNGWVSLIPTWMINFRNWSIPSPISPRGIIAPFWDDLKGKPDVGDSLRVAWYHDEVSNRFIVTWLDAYNWANIHPTGLEKMQLILEPREDNDGDIIFQYHTVWNQNQNRNYSTTGIQSPCNTTGIEYAFFNNYPRSATPIQEGLAIRFTTDPPDHYTSVTDVIKPSFAIDLKQNYPNPFNPDTVIEFSLSEPTLTTLEIYNVKGQKVRTLLNKELMSGRHQITWDGKDQYNTEVGSGIYLYKLITPSHIETKRMVLIK